MKNRYYDFFLSLIYDFASAFLSLMIAFKITGERFNFTGVNVFDFSLIAWPAILVLFLYFFKIYNILWRFSNFAELIRISAASAFAVATLFISQMAVFTTHFTLDVLLIMIFFTNVFLLAQRLCRKLFYSKVRSVSKMDVNNELSGNIMLIGGGSAASSIINEISLSKQCDLCKIKCVIDDDPAKKGQYISGIRIVGGRDLIIESAEKYNISIIVFAIPSCSSTQKFEILNICQQTNCQLKTVPSIFQVLNNQVITPSIRKVEIEDLLGRDPIDVNVEGGLDYVSDKVVMVTGGGGTIGSELCRQIVIHKPKQLIIFDVYENNAYDIQNELRKKYPDLNLVTLIGSVRDSKRLENIFKNYRPEIVYHAAAHKHVPLMEDSPNETIKNNVFGTYKTAHCADKYGVQKFVLISTDKAVNPTNVMGASKRICEMIIQTFNNRSDTEFVAVRFGNVLGSNGSVIPLFKKQIEQGGPITVTDPNIIRYFMTIPEAVSLVLQAGASAQGGEIFVLDMGKPVKILTLAENLIKLSGLVPYKDIKIEFIGLRPGEKLYEELLMSEEGLQDTSNSLIHIGRPIDFDEDDFLKNLEELRRLMYNEEIDIRSLIKLIVPTYQYVPQKNTINANKDICN